jgi:hypothetical protein
MTVARNSPPGRNAWSIARPSAGPGNFAADENYAARNWLAVQAFEQDHPLLWEIAPYFPPYGLLNEAFAYSILLISSAVMVVSGLGLQNLIDQLNHQDKLERMR